MPPDSTLPPVTISGLPQANQANVTDQFEVNQFGTTRSLMLGQVASLLATLNPPPAPVTINVTPPPSPSPGELWWNSDLGELFVWYDDGNSAQWVQASPTTAPGPPFSVGQTPLFNVDAYTPYLHHPVLTKSALYQEFDSSVTADIATASFIAVKNTGYTGAAVALLAQAEATVLPPGQNVFGANIVGAASVTGASVIAAEIDLVYGVNNGGSYASGVGVLIAAAGYAHGTTALQIHANQATATWGTGILFHHGSAGAASITDALIRSNTNPTPVDKGVDFFSTTFGTYDWLSQNFSVTTGGTTNVNRINIRGGIAGVSPTISAVGTDSNLSIALTPKGTGFILINGAARLAPMAVGALGAATMGKIAYVNDGAPALAWGATVTGGGTTPYLVSANGTAWTVAGK